MSKWEDKVEHPAFGSIAINRTTGGAFLYDSPIQHQHFISVTISKASFVPSHHYRFHHPGQDLVTVWLSAAQFAEAITSMNTSGVPCTLNRFYEPGTGKYMSPRLEAPDVNHKEHEEIIKKACEELVDKTSEATKQARAMLEGKTIKKSDLKALISRLSQLETEVSANIPWIQTSFVEATEKTVQKAKSEIVSLADHVVHTRGLKALGLECGEDLLGKQNILGEGNDENS